MGYGGGVPPLKPTRTSAISSTFHAASLARAGLLALGLLPFGALLLAAPADAAGGVDGVADAGGVDARARRDAGTLSKIPPDPPPMRERGQWIFDLRYDKGDVFLLGVHRITLPAPQETPRAMGRFALELYEGPALIERVRFDFPLLGAGDVLDGGYMSPPSFERKLSTRIGVMFPATSKGVRLELWDRATDKRFPLPWPPEETKTPPGTSPPSPQPVAPPSVGPKFEPKGT